jgi:predicted heme/steroid binding protein
MKNFNQKTIEELLAWNTEEGITYVIENGGILEIIQQQRR